MNVLQSQPKISQDLAKVKESLTTLFGDRAARLGKLEERVSQASGDLSALVDGGVSQLSEEIGKFAVEAKETVGNTAATVKNEVGYGLNEYNTKVQKIADKVPGDFSAKVTSYPWVAISLALTVGLLLGSVLKPARRALSNSQPFHMVF